MRRYPTGGFEAIVISLVIENRKEDAVVLALGTSRNDINSVTFWEHIKKYLIYINKLI